MKSILVSKRAEKKKMYFFLAAISLIVICVLLFYGDISSLATENIYKIVMKKAVPFLTAGTDLKPDVNKPEVNSPGVKTDATGIWPLRGTITSIFGIRGQTPHEGIDIAAPEGTPIYAFMDGTVIFSGWYEGYGNLVVIDHGYNIKTYYGHNSALCVTAGQRVKLGQHISNVGSTGDSTGPHCHFEIRVNGICVNPMDYLNKY